MNSPPTLSNVSAPQEMGFPPKGSQCKGLQDPSSFSILFFPFSTAVTLSYSRESHGESRRCGPSDRRKSCWVRRLGGVRYKRVSLFFPPLGQLSVSMSTILLERFFSLRPVVFLCFRKAKRSCPSLDDCFSPLFFNSYSPSRQPKNLGCLRQSPSGVPFPF